MLDFEEESPMEQAPSTSQQPVEAEGEPTVEAPEAPKEEWIVEKVLAIRMAKRRKVSMNATG